MTSHSASVKSGRFLPRMPAPAHATLKAAARASGLSLNAYCVRKLIGAGSDGPADEQAAAFISPRRRDRR